MGLSLGHGAGRVGLRRLLHRVAHGGDLPGGINVGPLLVALAAFAAVAAGLLLGGIAAAPRALLGRLRPPARVAEPRSRRKSA